MVGVESDELIPFDPSKTLLETLSEWVSVPDVVTLTTAELLTSPRLERIGNARSIIRSSFAIIFPCSKRQCAALHGNGSGMESLTRSATVRSSCLH